MRRPHPSSGTHPLPGPLNGAPTAMIRVGYLTGRRWAGGWVSFISPSGFLLFPESPAYVAPPNILTAPDGEGTPAPRLEFE